jgi:hypothetical protein
MTETGYTSWTTDRSMAVEAAENCADVGNLSGEIRVFRIRITTLDLERIIEGREDEYEFLIPGTVGGVEFSEDDEENEDDED